MTDDPTPDNLPDELAELAELADIAVDNKLIAWTWPVRLQYIRGEFLSLDMVAKGCEVTVKTVNAWVARGALPAYEYPGGRTVVAIGDLQDFLAPKLKPVTRSTRVKAEGESQA